MIKINNKRNQLKNGIEMMMDLLNLVGGKSIISLLKNLKVNLDKRQRIDILYTIR